MSDRTVKRGPGAMGAGPVEKAKDFKKSGKRLITQFAPFKIKIIAVLITSIIAVIFNIVSPKILGTATDAIVKGVSTGSIDFNFIKTVIISLVVMYALSALFTYFQEYIMASVSQNVVRKLRTDVSDKINNLPLKYFDKNTVGDILSRVTNDSETIGMALQRGVTQAITSFITVVGIIVIMLTISPIMTVITLVSLPLSLFDEISIKTPYITKLSPAGSHHLQDLNEAGGICAVMKELAKKGIIHTELPTVYGSVAERIAHADIERSDVIRTVEDPYNNKGAEHRKFGRRYD